MSLDFAVDDLSIHRIVELDAPFLPMLEMFPALTPELLESNRPWIADSLDAHDRCLLCYQCYLVRTPHHIILVDACLGNDKPRPRPEWDMRRGTEFMTGLARLGLTVDDIDYVMCTHLHVDHVGWNTRLADGRWVPTFPNARYIFERDEYAATSAAAPSAANASFQDSVLPIVAAGRAEMVDGDHVIGDHVRLIPTRGHTAGHVAIGFGKGRDRAVMTGDLVHSPLQLRYPHLSFVRDADPLLAAETRRRFLDCYADTDTLCCTAHFPSPSVGYVRRWSDGFRLVSPDGGEKTV